MHFPIQQTASHLQKKMQDDYMQSGRSLISYSEVVLYIGIMKVWGFWPEIITIKPAF